MPTSNTFYDLSYRLGTFLILLLKLQFFWLLTLLKGGIIFGFFPATATIFQVFLFLFTNKEAPQELASWYKKTTKRQFKAIKRYLVFSLVRSTNSCTFNAPFIRSSELIALCMPVHSGRILSSACLSTIPANI